jgi:FtsP/CotA-like multicopper oxidase with cupredoxin domain
MSLTRGIFPMKSALLICGLLAGLLIPAPVFGDTLSVAAVRDNTLYENARGELSNGSGERFFVGMTDESLRRRGLVAFDVSSIPPGSTINSATLRLYMSRTAASAQTITVHRALASWGEGASDAAGQEGEGAPSQPNDATWIHRFYPNVFWAAPGGDYSALSSASRSVGGNGSYEWTSAGLRDDVQAWVNQPENNHGWLLKGAENVDKTAKRFEGRRSSNASRRPSLIVNYTPPAGVGACELPSGDCELLTPEECAAFGGTFLGIGTSCPPPTGGCMLPDNSCEELTAEECAALGGDYLGDGVPCPEPGVMLLPFVDPLPLPGVAVPVGLVDGMPRYQMRVQQFQQKLHRDLPPTTVWGFEGSYPGPTIEARTGEPITVHWINDLRDAAGEYLTSHYLEVDTCLMGPDTEGDAPRIVIHLHGGHVSPENDGYPEWTILPGESKIYHYPNGQQAAPIWYHDHALGITRLNVYMGMAGFYLIRDDVEDALGLPAGEFDVPLAIQDRKFNVDGSLSYPAKWEDHFFGDHILVNGKVWPYFEVKQGKYRFRLLNGSGSRAYQLALSGGARFVQIGTDGGLLEAPVELQEVILLPGERADVVVDFSSYAAGTEIFLTNTAPIHFPGSPGDGVIPEVMKFIVTSVPGHVAPLPQTLRPVERLQESVAVEHRDFLLDKEDDPCTGFRWTINGLGWHDVTEYPILGTTEVWSFINRSGMSHPMHMHLIFFQVLDRQPFTMNGETVTPTGPRVPPPPWEMGWKDTVSVPPFEIVRVIARFEGFLGNYAYHCHILEHEDHEMMRQFKVVPPPEIESITYGPTGAAVTFMPAPHRLHTLERTDALDSGLWHPLATGLSGMGAITVADPDVADRDRRFYRVRVEPATGEPSPHMNP